MTRQYIHMDYRTGTYRATLLRFSNPLAKKKKIPNDYTWMLPMITTTNKITATCESKTQSEPALSVES